LLENKLLLDQLVKAQYIHIHTQAVGKPPLAGDQ